MAHYKAISIHHNDRAVAAAGKAYLLRSMHRPGKPLVLFNVWDPVTARIVEEAGFPAIATSSAAIAWSEGYPDGQCISRGRMLERVRNIAQAVSVPVTADLESAYGETMEDAVITARGAIAAGAVGLNVEDALDGALLDLDKHCARIAAMKFAGARLCVPLVINARTDVYWLGLGTDDEWRFAQTVFRANRFLEAGAACVFIPRVTQPRVIEKLRQWLTRCGISVRPQSASLLPARLISLPTGLRITKSTGCSAPDPDRACRSRGSRARRVGGSH